MSEASDSVQAAIEGELRLLQPEVRSSPELLDELLHPEFREFGASGRYWDRTSIIEALLEGEDPGPRPVVVSGMDGVELAPGVVHLTFDTELDGRRVHRSSIWRRTKDGWQMYFHQGTLFGG
ncbi:nuclear transport factor 2 family protein [Streptomyces sp. 15-116A]|uniref:nuclear transport factor 2 family protein n=1 Tax=Streptomyces sp. 15-116A TaxID=2259035 RepID=UPI0021B465E4|nr:nuclear transport factor 2 family protein [Streptomyces sp. 15-116A]MCT7352140.1 nuclear transport factor 2 family protein [Streptomyces sp. 15-116A]